MEIEVSNRRVEASAARDVYFRASYETAGASVRRDRVPAAMREAVALSIDRTAIHNVLLQKQGEISGALLPRWLSGYAFLFPANGIWRAHGRLRPAPVACRSAYDRQDAFDSADRANESKSMRAKRNHAAARAGAADVRLVGCPSPSRRFGTRLQDLATLLKRLAAGRQSL